METVELELQGNERMLLDALVKLKAHDPSLAFRRSCREGICDSDAMNINGKNGLACLTNLRTLKNPIVLKPLPGLPVVRDLIVDMTQFFAQYESIKPYLINETPPHNPAISEGMTRRYLTAHPMVKQVGALPGETVSLSGGRFRVDGRDMGPLTVLSADSQGRPLGAFPTPYTLKAGEFWLVSHPEKGFDSRYFGPVRRTDITHTAVAIF